MKVAVLGSGSRGNSILVASGNTRVLVDAGFSAKVLENRLGLLGVLPEEIDGIVVTHDHGDHTRGVGVFSRRHGTPVFITDPTREACGDLFRGGEDLRPYRGSFPFSIRSFTVEPFLTAHDARDPVAVALRDSGTGFKLGVATDLGRPTTQVRLALAQCDVLVLEANHDPGLLHQSPYPVSVRTRIASSHGHLSNEAAAQLAVELLHPRLGAVILAHLSAECNTPEMAEAVVGQALRDAGYRGVLEVAAQDTPSNFWDVAALHRRMAPEQLPLI